MSAKPCSICGSTDVNLVDGYYYCVECGTQDVNLQETIVEHTMLGDGTFAYVASRKFKTMLKDGIEMSGEWYKWHSYNFILAGLVDELINLGAKPSVKMKVLWVWARYIKQFQVKEDLGIASVQQNENCEGKIQENDVGEQLHVVSEQSDVEKKVNKQQREKSKDINLVTKGLLIAIIYVGLNLDKCDIQLSHLFRFIREDRLSIANCVKFIPDELNKNSIPNWKSFIYCTREYNPNNIRTLAMSIFKTLDIGTPIVPDLRKIIDNYIVELCLPNDFKKLVFSLMNLLPCDYLYLDKRTMKGLVRVPDYEAVAMSYVLVALKMCFGLDCDYEIRLSDAVDKINAEENYLKSYSLGMSEPTDRLFSFREWCNFLQFRKTMLCKYYLPIARQHNLDVDDHIFMEQLGQRNKRKKELSDEITMDILNKIPLNIDVDVIPKSKFAPSLTPMSTYTKIIQQYIQDPELKLLLSEDFTQYSLKYACVDLRLLIDEGNIVTGVNESNKYINKVIEGMLVCKTADMSMIYVKNCENKNWLKTNQPTVDHIIIKNDNEDANDKMEDQGYISHKENIPITDEIILKDDTKIQEKMEIEEVILKDDTEIQEEMEINDELEFIIEEDEKNNIFDDTMINLNDDETEIFTTETNTKIDSFEFHNDSAQHEQHVVQFDPETFDRENTIKELVLLACETYKIPIPKEYKPIKPRTCESIKRKSQLINLETGEVVKKRRILNQTKIREDKKLFNEIMTTYYSALENNVQNEVQDHVQSNIQNNDVTKDELEVNPSNTLNETDSLLINDTMHSDSDNIEINNESSVIEQPSSDVDDVECLIPKINNKFDEKTHDIKQLYVKFTSELKFEDIVSYDDEEVDLVLDKIIKEDTNRKLTLKQKTIENHSDSEDDIPLKELYDEKKFFETKIKNDEKLIPLIKNSDNIEFKYWFRHYSTSSMKKNLDMMQRFDLELKVNYPSSFDFMIHECAAILDCTAYSLYKCMQDIEKRIVL